MSVLATPRLLVGRKIVAVEMGSFPDRDIDGKTLRICHDPVLVLDNGARVHFVVEETDQGDHYGIRPCYSKSTGSAV